MTTAAASPQERDRQVAQRRKQRKKPACPVEFLHRLREERPPRQDTRGHAATVSCCLFASPRARAAVMSSSRGVLLVAAWGLLLCLPDYGRCQSRAQVVFEDDHGNKCPPDKPHCVTVEQCRPAQLQIRRGQHPIICDWQKTTSLVCCQEPINVDMPPSEGTGKPSVHPDPAHPEPVPPGPDQPEPNQPEPDQPEPVQPQPVTPGPVDPEPVNPEPVNPEPVNPQPLVLDL
ncbi:unnamed protein product [Ixodes persulcatus]